MAPKQDLASPASPGLPARRRMATAHDEAARVRVSLAWRRRFAVLVGGCAGSALRIAVGALVADTAGWPWSTLTVNLTGALLLGYLVARVQRRSTNDVLSVPLLGTGLLGSYTTFSALSAETWQLWTGGELGLAAGYAAVSMLGGLLLAAAGNRLAER